MLTVAFAGINACRRSLISIRRRTTAQTCSFVARSVHLNAGRCSSTNADHHHTTIGVGDGKRSSHNSNNNETAGCPTSSDDDPYYEDKEAVTKLGVYANVALAVTKSGMGLLSGSAVLLADGLHSFSDLASDLVTFGVLRITAKPADSLYPWGYGRFDALGTLAVASLLVVGSCGIGYHSLDALLASTVNTTTGVDAVPSLLSGTEGLIDTNGDGINMAYAWPALGVAVASVGVKEALYRRTLAVGKRSRSNVLVANAWHHRSDALSSVVAIAGIGGSMAGLPMFDTFGGILVSGMILKQGVSMGWDAIQELSDASVQRDVVDRIRKMTARLKVRAHTYLDDAYSNPWERSI